MQGEPRRILFVHYGENLIRGSERCLLDLVRYLDRKTFTPVVWCNSEVLANEFKKLEVKTIRTDLGMLLCGSRSPFDFVRFYQSIKTGLDIISAEHIDLIHANGGAPNQWMNVVARIKRLPLVCHLHARYPLRERFVLGLLWPSRTIGVSQSVADQLISDGLNHDSVRVIPNGIDTVLQDQAKPVDVRSLLSIPKQHFVIMTTASLIRRKGIDLLIHATTLLVDHGLSVHLVIAGDGPDKAALLALAMECNIVANVHFLGECKKPAALLQGGVDIFVSGSREEVFGLALAEASLAGLPVIAPRVGGISGVVDHQKTGLLVKPECSQSIALAVKYLIDWPELRQKYGDAGREKVLRDFNMRDYVERFHSTYLDLLHDPKYRLHGFYKLRLPLVMKMMVRSLRVYFKKRHSVPRADSSKTQPIVQIKI